MSAPGEPAATRTFVCAVAAACLIAKLGILVLDDRMRLFMGDSATYLWSAVSLQAPLDRSFTYPLLIRLTAGASGSITMLLWVQSLCGVATSLMVYRLLRRSFAVRPWIAAAAALLIALDPSQLFYERMVMTESVSTCVLVASLCAALTYLRCRQLRYLALCILFGVALASLRVGLVPLAWALGPAAVLLANRTSLRACARPLLFAVVATWACHSAYQHEYGRITHSHPGYIRDGGFFRLGLVAPLVNPASFDGTGLDASLLDDVTIPLGDPHLREAQIWQPGGLIDVLKQHGGPRAYRVAARLASNAIRNDPIGVARLGLQTLREYFDANYYRTRLASDLADDRVPDAKTLELLRTHFNYDVNPVAPTPSPVYRYFENASVWLVCCLFSLMPLSMLVIVACRRRCSREGLLLGLVGIGLVIGEILCSHIISFRYLHPFPVMEIMCLGIVVNTAGHFRQPQSISAQPALRASLQTS
ncbi:MAG TPA: glycosyltransferase family 39 protein [Rudaea sp.]|nr:glycosyltransferase family 39 protein [Rudaea sp.]